MSALTDLKADVLATLRDGVAAIRADLWQPQDAHTLELVAHDLVQLARKVATTDDPAKLAQYRRSAKLLLDHVELLALRRARHLEREVQERIEELFREKVLPALIGLIPAVL